MGLRTAFWGEFDSVIWNGLVDVAVFWIGLGDRQLDREGQERTVSFRLGMAH